MMTASLDGTIGPGLILYAGAIWAYIIFVWRDVDGFCTKHAKTSPKEQPFPATVKVVGNFCHTILFDEVDKDMTHIAWYKCRFGT